MGFMYNSITSITEEKKNEETGFCLKISVPFKFVVNIDFPLNNFLFTFATCLFPTTFIWIGCKRFCGGVWYGAILARLVEPRNLSNRRRR
jgi:hypothetical protein